jgi:hypothetical protein
MNLDAESLTGSGTLVPKGHPKLRKMTPLSIWSAHRTGALLGAIPEVLNGI